MFKVKATIIDFLGEKETFPCHHGYRLGDAFTFDGAVFSGGICPSFAITVVPRMMEVHAFGPRYKDYIHYYPFLYAPPSVEDPAQKKLDGLGYKNIFAQAELPRYHVGRLASSSSFKWPPQKRIENRMVRLICPDYRTSVVMKIEAYDISDAGRNIPFFRREMAILDKVLQKPGIKATDILGEFTKKQIEGIYPALSQPLLDSLLEELELMGYVKIKEGKVTAGKKARAKLDGFKGSLTVEEKKALKFG